MKNNLLFFAIILTGATAYCQDIYNVEVASVANDDRINLVKNSIPVSEWHERSFWSLYNTYVDKVDNLSFSIHATTDSLLKCMAGCASNNEFELASRLLTAEHHAFDVRQSYFNQMNDAFNGVTALGFLQTEELMGILENLKVFENNSNADFRFYPWVQEPREFNVAKHNAILKALKLSHDEEGPFFAVYYHYEKECDDFLGENYNLFELFNEEPSDFTPGLAKVQGNNLLQLLQREITLKERYFKEMNKIAGPSLAARFVLWEDYYSTVNKMYAWSDNVH